MAIIWSIRYITDIIEHQMRTNRAPCGGQVTTTPSISGAGSGSRTDQSPIPIHFTDPARPDELLGRARCACQVWHIRHLCYTSLDKCDGSDLLSDRVKFTLVAFVRLIRYFSYSSTWNTCALAHEGHRTPYLTQSAVGSCGQLANKSRPQIIQGRIEFSSGRGEAALGKVGGGRGAHEVGDIAALALDLRMGRLLGVFMVLALGLREPPRAGDPTGISQAKLWVPIEKPEVYIRWSRDPTGVSQAKL
eukprot:1024709-Prorocentrum_minimum.AAC.4